MKEEYAELVWTFLGFALIWSLAALGPYDMLLEYLLNVEEGQVEEKQEEGEEEEEREEGWEEEEVWWQEEEEEWEEVEEEWGEWPMRWWRWEHEANQARFVIRWAKKGFRYKLPRLARMYSPCVSTTIDVSRPLFESLVHDREVVGGASIVLRCCGASANTSDYTTAVPCQSRNDLSAPFESHSKKTLADVSFPVQGHIQVVLYRL